MNRRNFSNTVLSLGAAAQTGMAQEQYDEPARKLPARRFDVVVAGGGTAGVVAAIAAARNGAKTILIEAKGYPGGTVVEGGTALLWVGSWLIAAGRLYRFRRWPFVKSIPSSSTPNSQAAISLRPVAANGNW